MWNCSLGSPGTSLRTTKRPSDYLRKLAANNIEFHKGHSELAEFLVAGQAAACVTCYAHHYPPRIKKGAPLGYMLTEGIATITANALAKDAPHPNAARLFYRWSASEEGQKAYAAGGRPAAASESGTGGEDSPGSSLSDRHGRNKGMAPLRKSLEGRVQNTLELCALSRHKLTGLPI